jgi:hypothetical protein
MIYKRTTQIVLSFIIVLLVIVVTMNAQVDLLKKELSSLTDLKRDIAAPQQQQDTKPIVIYVLVKFPDENADKKLTEGYSIDWAKHIQQKFGYEVKSVPVSSRKVAISIPAEHATDVEKVRQALMELPNVEYAERKMEYTIMS